jgi:RNA polymerase sigma factor (sigma-70 family)
MPDSAAPARPEELISVLNAQRAAFKSFLAARVGNDAEAEDLLQNGLVKALQRAGELRDNEKVVPWFYQLLRHAIIDHYRSAGAARRRHDALGTLVSALEEDVVTSQAFETRICTCMDALVKTLPASQAQLLRRVDLDGASVQDAARELGLTPNNASVTLHRARRNLKTKLEQFCGDCAAGACLDCDCGE